MPLFAIPFPVIDPVLIEVGPIAIRWYALAYVAGLLLGWMYVSRVGANAALYRRETPPLPAGIFDDFLLWAALGVVLGGRLGFVFVYNFDYYMQNPMEILQLWRGGMSFHGGFLGIILVTFVYARLRGIPPLVLGDLLAAAAPIGIFFGRIANFINAELYGRVTDLPWGMVFPGAGPEPRHPSQLYEAALEGLLLFIILRILTHRMGALTRPGTVIGTFLVGYGLGRSIAELFRQPDLQLGELGFYWGGLTMGIMLSLPMIVIGIALIFWAQRRPPIGEPVKTGPKS